MKRPMLMFFFVTSFGRKFHTLAQLDINDFWYVAVLHFGVMNFRQLGSVDALLFLCFDLMVECYH